MVHRMRGPWHLPGKLRPWARQGRVGGGGGGVTEEAISGCCSPAGVPTSRGRSVGNLLRLSLGEENGGSVH